MKKYSLYLIILSVSIISFAILTIMLSKNNFVPSTADKEIADFFYSIRGVKYGFAYWYFRIFTEMGYVWFLSAFILIFGIIFKWDKRFFLLALCALSAYFINALIKKIFMRERPLAEYRWMSESSSSYPSGHSAVAVCFYFVLAFVAKQTKEIKIRRSVYIFCIFAASTVMISRMVLGVHYLTDVIAGLFIGLIVAVLSIIVYKIIQNKKKKAEKIF